MPKNVCLPFSVLLIAVCFYHLATWPISASDTDLWYHLNGGRYLFENGHVPTTSFFSFLEPQRAWVDYYWLFQALVYKVFSWWGYQGLIFMRAALTAAMLIVLFLFFYRRWNEREAFLYYTLVIVLYTLVFLSRSLAVRPHLFSYLFVLIFLYVLECKPRALWLLPILSVVWMNLHGIEYPVMLLIIGAYAAELLWQRLKKREGDRFCARLIIFGCCGAAVVITPHGSKLLGIPFTSMAQVSPFIYELRHLSVYDFMSFFGILFFLSLFTAYKALRDRTMRISHLILLVGGIVLLTGAKRFVNEYVLLAAPLLAAYVPVISAAEPTRRLKTVCTVLAIMFMAMPFFFMHYFFSNPPRHPLSAAELPEGVALYLKRVNAQGVLLNHPDTGGYYEWELYPKCRIFMDLQVPFLFTGNDFETARDAYAKPNVLREIIEHYRPSFITVPIARENFKSMIRHHPEYQAVFFDDAEVLYADCSRVPGLVPITGVDPFAIYTGALHGTKGGELGELLRLHDIYPAGAIVNAAIAAIYQRDGRYSDALPYARTVSDTHPESYLGYKLQADLLAKLGSCGEAQAFYEKAVDRSEGAVREDVEVQRLSCKRLLQGKLY